MKLEFDPVVRLVHSKGWNYRTLLAHALSLSILELRLTTFIRFINQYNLIIINATTTVKYDLQKGQQI